MDAEAGAAAEAEVLPAAAAAAAAVAVEAEGGTRGLGRRLTGSGGLALALEVNCLVFGRGGVMGCFLFTPPEPEPPPAPAEDRVEAAEEAEAEEAAAGCTVTELRLEPLRRACEPVRCGLLGGAAEALVRGGLSTASETGANAADSGSRSSSLTPSTAVAEEAAAVFVTATIEAALLSFISPLPALPPAVLRAVVGGCCGGRGLSLEVSTEVRCSAKSEPNQR